MLRLLSIVRIALPLLAAALCAACIDSREEVWIERDGSGRAEIQVRLPAAASRLHGGESGLRKLIEESLSATPGIRTTSLEIAPRPDGRVAVDLAVAFDSAMDISEVASSPSLANLPPAARLLAGEVDARLNGLTFEFKRTISPAAAIPGAAWMPSDRLAGHRLDYIVHLPEAAKSSNATRTENDGRTLVWEIPLDKAVRAPFCTRFTVDVPIPWAAVSAVAIPLSLAGGWFLIRRVRRPAAPTARTP